MSGRQRVEMRVPGLPEPLSHYTDAMRFGDILFVSGLTPLDENARLIGEGDVVGQARQIHVNLEKVLTHAEASFADVFFSQRGRHEAAGSITSIDAASTEATTLE